MFTFGNGDALNVTAPVMEAESITIGEHLDALDARAAAVKAAIQASPGRPEWADSFGRYLNELEVAHENWDELYALYPEHDPEISTKLWALRARLEGFEQQASALPTGMSTSSPFWGIALAAALVGTAVAGGIALAKR